MTRRKRTVSIAPFSS